MDELKFDTMEVNTKLAEDFLATHKVHLEKLQSLSEQTVTKLEIFANMDTDFSYTDINFMLTQLMKKVQENSELIAQLAVLTQGRIKEDILKYDLKLIEENLKYWNSHTTTLHTDKTFHYIDYPLAFLGYVAECKNFTFAEKLIKYNNSTLPVAYLFARLCCQAGFLLLEFQRCEEEANTSDLSDAEFNGCTAVISEQADVDSAVDSVLASASHDPWRLHRVYVQESVYDRVKRALSWKCGLKDKQEATDILNLVSLKYGNKTLIFDYPDRDTDSSEPNQTIFVEAYRTVKELLSLLKKGNSFCLSVWSNDVSVSNEIAFSVMSPIVWINDYGTVDGPVSRAFYTTFTPGYKYEPKIEFCKLIDDWSKLSTNERVKEIYKSLEQFETETDDEKSRDFVKKIKIKVKCMPSNKFFENTDGKMWINILIPKGMVIISDTYHNSDEYVENLLISAARGNVIVCDELSKENPTDHYKNLLLYLCKNSPFVCLFNTLYNTPHSDNVTQDNHYRERVIVINYGTIFAN